MSTQPVALGVVIAVQHLRVISAHETSKMSNGSSMWWAWTWDPLIISLLSVSAVLYVVGLGRMRGTTLVSPWRAAAFAAGWLTLVVALLSPVHRLSSLLLSVHMTQHELLMLVAAPLVVMGQPLVLILWALPLAGRMTVGSWIRTRPVARGWHAITGPFNVWLIHGAVVWIWHIPALYEAALASEGLHALQHTMFFVTAALFWWALIYGRYGRMGYGIAVAYVFTTALHTGLLGALFTFATGVWYATYEGSTAPWGLSALEDQQVAGLVMWVPGGVVFTLIGLALFAAWLGEAERRVRTVY